MAESEMIERVARAIYEADPAEDQETDIDGRSLGKPYPIPWDSICEFDAPSVEVFRRMARAAFEAMRRPTEAMDDAGCKVCDEQCRHGGHINNIWAAMIDKALAP